MRSALIDLIARMTVREGNVNSDQSVAWHAHREAEALSDASLIGELADYVQRESKQDSRSAAYFILGKLGEKFPTSECAALLVERAKQENNKYVLATLLDALGHIPKPTDLDLTPVYALLADDQNVSCNPKLSGGNLLADAWRRGRGHEPRLLGKKA